MVYDRELETYPRTRAKRILVDGICCLLGIKFEKAKTRCVYPRQVGGGNELLPWFRVKKNGENNTNTGTAAVQTTFGRYSNISYVLF